MISSSSSTASSTPATSLKVILGWSTAMRLARDLPKLITLLPPPCIWFMRKMKKTHHQEYGRKRAEQRDPDRTLLDVGGEVDLVVDEELLHGVALR